MRTQSLKFDNAQGEQLSAQLAMPADRHPRACALFAHCFTCNKNLTAIHNISRALTAAGFAVMRFDFTGLGESEGDFANTNFSSNVEDLIAAADQLAEMIESPTVLIGHSLGGAAALMAAGRIDSVKAVATIGAPSEPDHVAQHLDGHLDTLESEGVAQVDIGGRPFTVKKQFLDDIRTVRLEERIHELRKPLLIMHSPVDEVVGIDNAQALYKAAMHPKSFISLDHADHLLSRREDSLYVGALIGAWAGRYIGQGDEEPSLERRKQVVVRTGREKYTTEIQTARHSLTADEPARVGGNDFGPTPYDLLLASLGACTSMTLRMYADRKDWALESVTVHLQHSREHVEDLEAKRSIDVIERQIELEGALDAAQRERLLEIADRCPVHKTLHNQLEVRTTLG
jgi:putative redox protein